MIAVYKSNQPLTNISPAVPHTNTSLDGFKFKFQSRKVLCVGDKANFFDGKQEVD